MEEITANLMVSKLSTTLVDESRKATPALPMLFRGVPSVLVMKLYNSNGSVYPAAQLEGKTWRLVISNVWNPQKTPQLETTDITVENNVIRAVMEETDTQELAMVIGTMESVTLGAELYGISAGESKASIVLQFGIQVHNRRGGTGTPTQVSSDGITGTQVNALLSAGLEVECSAHGRFWEATDAGKAQSYRYYRLRNPALANAQWSEPIPMIVGPAGPAGSIEIGTVEAGENAAVTNAGTAQNAILNLVLPRGLQGRPASVSVAETATGEPGTQAGVTNEGDEHAAILKFTIPRGADGTVAFDSLTDAQRLSLKGDKGDAATVRVGGVTTIEPGEDASVSNAGTSGDAILQFAIPKGDRGEKGDKGDRGDTGPAGPACSLTVGTVTATETGTAPTANITGEAPNQVLNLTMPKGIKGDKGDNATIAVGTVRTGAAGTSARVSNSGTETNAVLDFTIPKGDKGDATYIRVAWARDSLGTGFSLTPSDDRKYRAELALTEPRENLTAEDFVSCAWIRCSGDDGVNYGAVAVTDGNAVVPEVRKITFANATLTAGADGEAVVTFSGGGGTPGDGQFAALDLLRNTLASSRAGGGSPGGDAGRIAVQDGFIPDIPQSDTSQSTWEA